MKPYINKMARKRKCSNLKLDALKWLNHIQMHGATRLASGESRWFWIPSMILFLIFTGTLLYIFITRYLSNPTYMLQIDSDQTVFSFPSVIIYPEVSFRGYKKREFISKLKYPKGFNRSYVRSILPQLGAFFSPDVHYQVQDLENLEHVLQFNNMDVETAGRRLTESCEEILIRCRWHNNIQNCSNLFRMELTRDGFCCVFNGRSLRREMQESTRVKKTTQEYYTGQIGYSSGLMVVVNQTQKPWNIDLAYKWIAIQTSQRFVDPTINGTALNPGREQWVAFYMQSTYITETAKGLGAYLRRCAMSSEQLKYFPDYRRRYCALECEIASTIRRCGCVRLTHPRPPGVTYCTAKRLSCALWTTVSPEGCTCPATCNVHTPMIRISSFSLDLTVPSYDSFYKDLSFDKVTVVRAFIQKRVISKQRTSYYSYVDLFSQIGGMFNMFFGCSVLTMLGLIHLIWRIVATMFLTVLNSIPRMKKKN